MIFRVEHIGLAARDPVALKEWYHNIFGAVVLFDNKQSPPSFLLQMPGGMIFELYPATESTPKTALNNTAGWRHLALLVDNIEAACAFLQSCGISFDQPIKPAGGGGRVRFFSDPEGNILHLVERNQTHPPTG